MTFLWGEAYMRHLIGGAVVGITLLLGGCAQDNKATGTTGEPDDAYTTFSAGFSMVLRGGRQREIDGPIAGGLMGFLQFKSIENLQYFDDRVITGGFRYEF